MQINPKYGENIIVGVQYNGEFSWYVTERDCWILDLEKRKNNFIKNGFEYDVAELLPFRSNFLIVDKKKAGDYLAYLSQYKVNSSQLRKRVMNKQYEDTILSLAPSLLIDFDNKALRSSYPEDLRFEDYVPDGWIGKYEAFLDDIPRGDRYWMRNGVDLIKEAYNEEIKEFYGGSQ